MAKSADFNARLEAITENPVMALSVAVRAFAEKINVAVPAVVEKIAVDLHGMISKRNPVDTGLSRSRWTIREGTPDNTPYTKEKVADKNGVMKRPRGPNIMPPGGISGEQIVYVTNNVDYVPYLEAGSSKQAPAGMVKISLYEIEAQMNSILAQFSDA